MMGIVVPETCWVYKKHNKIRSEFVFHTVIPYGKSDPWPCGWVVFPTNCIFRPPLRKKYHPVLPKYWHENNRCNDTIFTQARHHSRSVLPDQQSEEHSQWFRRKS